MPPTRTLKPVSPVAAHLAGLAAAHPATPPLIGGDAGSKKLKLNDRTDIGLLRNLIAQALTGPLKEAGLSLKLGKGTFSGDGSDMKFDFVIIADAADGAVVTPYELEFKKSVRFYAHEGLKAEHLHQTYTIGGVQYEIMGMMARAQVKPLIVKKLRDGKLYRQEPEVAVKFLDKKG